ncbi:MAG TPA: NADP-dependent isocitrate dehydrogenase, partial [Deltaproteobacteria bacterium]|nr:NADP-dependent isocitrate dehydrogenase [Deltaproteobacteria bacterium]
MKKISVKTPIVEMDGDEMTRIMWAQVKEKLLLPWLDVKLEVYDLHVKHRDD